MGMNAHNTRIFLDDDTYADMEEVRAILTRGLKRRISNRLLLKIAMKYVKEGARNGSLQPFLTRVRLGTADFEEK